MDFQQMDDRELQQKIAAIIIAELKLEDVTPASFDPALNLVDELGIDSMDLTTVVLVLQEEFGVPIQEEDYPELKTVAAIAQFLRQRQPVAA